ncbi:3-methyladenine DNA glycosylase [Angustibacter speluncae]
MVEVLHAGTWTQCARDHEAAVDARLAAHLDRRRRAEKHPVEDFLFTYYRLRPAALRRWHPGAGTSLATDGADPVEVRERAGWRWYEVVDGALGLDVGTYLADREGVVRFVRDLLTATAARPAQLGCFGLHEWAMVYRLPAGAQRHEDHPLRLGSAGTDAVVEQNRLRCSHFDAYRFFTPEAVPLNPLQPSRSRVLELEQPGCLHATMDLYKWAGQLGPAVPSSLLLACFDLARDVRVLDMEASPYDLADLGYEPVRIETPDGKAEYARRQKVLAERAAPLRVALVEVCDAVLAQAGDSGRRIATRAERSSPLAASASRTARSPGASAAPSTTSNPSRS